jgi:hypothetical protein
MANTTFHEQAEILRNINRKVRMLTPYEKGELSKIAYTLEELEKLKAELAARAEHNIELESSNGVEEDTADLTAETLAKLLGFKVSK